MAAIGDVLVKFVADFAEFSSNMDKSQKQIESWMQSISKAGESLDGFISLAKRVSGALAIGEAIKQVIDYANNIQKAAVTSADLARQTGLTAEQVQALQALATKTGDSFADLAKKGQANHDWLDQVTADAQRLGQVMDNSVVRTLKDLQVESDEASRRMQVFFAPAVAGTKSWIADQLERMAADLTTIGMQQGVIDKIIALAQMLGYGGGAGASQQFRIDSLTDQVARREAELAAAQQGPTPREIGMGVQGRSVEDAQKALDDARALLGQAKDAAAKAAYGTATLDAKAITVTAPAPGGGGTTDADSIEAQIRRYQALADAATKAQKTISEGNAQNIEDLKRQVTVQQQVDDIVGKLAAKHITITDDQHKRLTQAVTDAETQRAAEQKAVEVQQAAVETDKKYGDGKVTLTKLHKDLADQLKTNRINQDDYNRATKEGTEAIQQSALAAQRYDDNLGSLAAGFEHAANAYARSNDLYSQGEQLFSGLTNAMTEGLQALEGQSSKTFAQIALDFANMLAQMALKAAVSQVFTAIFGAATGTPFASIAGINTANAAAGLPAIPGLQHGGPVSAGQSYVVGEAGPELFVPTAAGNIVPSGATAAGGGSNVTVNVDMSTTQGSPDPANMLQFGRQMKAAIKDVIQNEKRPGGSLYSRVSG